jgi:hypothetical protein
MANYYASARTNYFAVKDVELFEKAMEKIPGIEVIKREQDGIVLVGLLASDDDGSFPIFVWNEELDQDEELDWEQIFADHLQDDWVAVMMEVGHEKLRFLNGYTIAYNNKKETVGISLDGIYGLAKSLGSNITEATY